MSSLRSLTKQLIPRQHLPAVMEIYGLLQSSLYGGDQVICPCCNGRFRKFLPGGVDRRPNAVCPRCNSLERHRLLWLYLKNKTNILHARLKVLHIAPEYVFQKAFTSMDNISYVSAGLNAPFANVVMDITNILDDDNSFDVILCNHVLEHIMDDQKAMKELFRVLKPEGWAILQSPVDVKREKTFEDPSIVLPKERERFFGKDDHVRVYGLDYKDRLEQAGFTVKIDSYTKSLGIEMIEKCGLSEDEDIYFCTKLKS